MAIDGVVSSILLYLLIYHKIYLFFYFGLFMIMFVFNLFISIAGSKGKNEPAKISSFQSI